MLKRLTKFNPNWMNKYKWLREVQSDDTKAFCKLCSKTFSVATKGELSVKEHGDGAKHKEYERSSKSTYNMQRFFTRTLKFDENVFEK